MAILLITGGQRDLQSQSNETSEFRHGKILKRFYGSAERQRGGFYN